MKRFQFTSDLLDIINALLQVGINGCTVHETRGLLDNLFDSFEEFEGLETDTIINRGDLEHFFYQIDSIYQAGSHLWSEDKTDTHVTENFPTALDHLFPNLDKDIQALTIFPKSEGEANGTI